VFLTTREAKVVVKSVQQDPWPPGVIYALYVAVSWMYKKLN
jgi:hypothetical protein